MESVEELSAADSAESAEDCRASEGFGGLWRALEGISSVLRASDREARLEIY